jgi:hypothetical protein
MNDQVKQQQHRQSAEFIIVRNFPTDTTEQSLAEFLWSSIGLDLPPEDVRIEAVNTLDPKRKGERYASIALTRETLATFLGRYLSGVPMNGNELVITPRDAGRRAKQRAIAVYATARPGGAEPTERWKRKL